MIILHCLTALASLLTTAAHAQVSISGVANGVSNGLSGGFGGGGFVGIVEFLRSQILVILTPIGIFFVVRSGMRLINSQEEDKLSKAKTTIAAVCAGLMLAYVSDQLVAAFYTPGGAWNNSTSSTGAQILSTEIFGVIDWATMAIAILAILIIIVSGLKAVSSFGSEDTGVIKRTLIGVVTGILLITSAGAIRLSIGVIDGVALPSGISPAPIISRGVGIVLVILGFTSLVALAVVIYAGMMMVLNMGNEENFTKGKSLIYRAMIGLVVMLLSGAAVVFIASFFI